MQVSYVRLWTWIAVLLLVGSLPASSAFAQEAPPADKSAQPVGIRSSDGPPGAIQDANGLWRMKAGAEPVQSADFTATGGPDDYGYVWDDSVALNWIDATDGTDTGLSGESWNQRTEPIPLPFPFKYYDAVYSNVHIGAAGYITFQDSPNWTWRDQVRTPLPSVPNTVVSPFSTPLDLATSGISGRVFYKTGGVSPNRYFVVTWNDVKAWDTDDRYTFQVVLYENGDILFQYQAMTWDEDSWYWCGYVGIEDAEGLDGFGYGLPNCVPPSILFGEVRAIRFTRPMPSARVKLSSREQGRFSRAGSAESFQTAIRNTGDLGADTYDLVLSSTWLVTFYAADGVTPLVDTDGDGIVDTGSLSQGGTYTVTVKVQTPLGAVVGANNAASITVRSSLNSSKSKTVVIRTAIPAPFAQVYQEADGAMSLHLVQPAGQTVKRVTSDQHFGYDTTVTETPNGDFVYAWYRSRCLGVNCAIDVVEIEYALLNRYGETIRAASKLVNHNSATVYTYDIAPVVAVAPDGRIGILWYRYLWNGNTAQSNYNIYFAILDASGNRVYGPVNLTNNTAWGGRNDLSVPSFWVPRIAATGDNRFILAWTRYSVEPPAGDCTGQCRLNDIYYAIHDTNGGAIRESTKLTNGIAGGIGYSAPTLAALNNNRAFVGYTSDSRIHYVVLNSSGGIVKAQSDIASQGWNPDAVQLANGRIAMAWTSPTPVNPGEGVWTTQFYNNETLTGPPVLTRIDHTIDFDWWEDAPAPGVNPDFFSARWTGTITVDEGIYSFWMGSDDGSRMWIDGQLVMDHWNECCVYWSTTVPLSAGAHQVQMEMHEHDGAAWAYLSWQKQDDKPATTFAVLDTAYNVIIGPTRLNNPAVVTGDMYVSVAADAAGRAILTWMDNDSSVRYNLYYALVDNHGAVLTPPMIFRSAQGSLLGDRYITSSYEGYGNTSYNWTPPVGVDGVATFSASLTNGPPGGSAAIGIQTTNRGAAVAAGVTLTATLGAGLTYDSDTSGVAPTVSGNTVVWNLPDMGLFDSHNFVLYVQTPAGTNYGARYPVALTLASNGPEVNPSNNTATTEVMVARQVFLPVTTRSRD